MLISFTFPDHKSLTLLKALMSKLDEDTQKVLKELADFKTALQAKQTEADNLQSQLIAIDIEKQMIQTQLDEALTRVPSEQTVADLAAEAETNEAPQS